MCLSVVAASCCHVPTEDTHMSAGTRGVPDGTRFSTPQTYQQRGRHLLATDTSNVRRTRTPRDEPSALTASPASRPSVPCTESTAAAADPAPRRGNVERPVLPQRQRIRPDQMPVVNHRLKRRVESVRRSPRRIEPPDGVELP